MASQSRSLGVLYRLVRSEQAGRHHGECTYVWTANTIQNISAVELQVSNVGPWVGVQPEVKSTRWFQPGRPDPASLSSETAQVSKRAADEKLRVEPKESKPRGVGGDGTNLHNIGIRDHLPLNGSKASQLYCIDSDRRKISEECRRLVCYEQRHVRYTSAITRHDASRDRQWLGTPGWCGNIVYPGMSYHFGHSHLEVGWLLFFKLRVDPPGRHADSWLSD